MTLSQRDIITMVIKFHFSKLKAVQETTIQDTKDFFGNIFKYKKHLLEKFILLN